MEDSANNPKLYRPRRGSRSWVLALHSVVPSYPSFDRDTTPRLKLETYTHLKGTLMPDFSALLKKPAGEAKRPPVLPVGDYQGVIRSHEVGDSNRNHTPYVRFGIVLTEWPESIDPADRPDIELNKRQMRRDFFLTEDSLWRLDEFIRSCGVDPAGRMYEEVLPELVGQPVTAQVQHFMSQTREGEVGNNIGEVVGQYGKV